MKYILPVILILFMAMSAFSQEIFTGISYNMGTTVSDTRDFITDYSWRGFGFEFRNYRSNNVSIGFSASWNIFDQKTNEIIELEQAAVSGTQIRYFNAFPLMLNAHYYIGNNYDQVRPFVGLNYP